MKIMIHSTPMILCIYIQDILVTVLATLRIYPFRTINYHIRRRDQDSTEYTPWHIAAQQEYTKWSMPLVYVFFVFYSEIVIEHIISSSLLLLYDKTADRSTYSWNISFWLV